MKKLSMVLAVVAMMISTTTQAQLTKKPDNRRGTRTAVKSIPNPSVEESIPNPSVEDDKKVKIFGTLFTFTESGRSVVKVEFDEIVQSISPDKSALKDCIKLENYRYSSLGEALNILSTHGWTPDMVWTSEDNRKGTIAHMVISKEIDKFMPVSPWNSKQGAKGGEDAKSSGKTR